MSLKVRSTYRSEVVQVEGSLYVPSRFLLSFLKCLVLRAEKKKKKMELQPCTFSPLSIWFHPNTHYKVITANLWALNWVTRQPFQIH